MPLGSAPLPLQPGRKASPFWIMMLLFSGAFEHRIRSLVTSRKRFRRFNSAVLSRPCFRIKSRFFHHTDNYVMMPRYLIKNDTPTLALEKIGRSEAATFTGLCAKHGWEKLTTRKTFC